MRPIPEFGVWSYRWVISEGLQSVLNGEGDTYVNVHDRRTDDVLAGSAIALDLGFVL